MNTLLVKLKLPSNLICLGLGAKSPPGLECGEGGGLGEGITLSPVNEYLQRKALITTVQQVSGEVGGYHTLTSQ